MYYQFAAYFFQLDNTFIGIHHLLQKNRLITYNSKWMCIIKIVIQLHQFFYWLLAMQCRTDKNSTGKITTPRYKAQSIITGRIAQKSTLQLRKRLNNLTHMLMVQSFISLYIIG